MKLLDVFESSKTTEYADTFKALKEKYGEHLKLADFCEGGTYDRKSGYAQVTYRGTLKEDVELTELELSMICDNGYGHFGGSSSIYKRDFTVVIYVD